MIILLCLQAEKDATWYEIDIFAYVQYIFHNFRKLLEFAAYSFQQCYYIQEIPRPTVNFKSACKSSHNLFEKSFILTTGLHKTLCENFIEDASVSL